MYRQSTVDVERFAGLWFQPHWSFHRNTFALPWLKVLLINFSIIKRGAYIHRKTFAVLLKTVKSAKV